jgi:hypothetical protein
MDAAMTKGPVCTHHWDYRGNRSGSQRSAILLIPAGIPHDRAALNEALTQLGSDVATRLKNAEEKPKSLRPPHEPRGRSRNEWIASVRQDNRIQGGSGPSVDQTDARNTLGFNGTDRHILCVLTCDQARDLHIAPFREDEVTSLRDVHSGRHTSGCDRLRSHKSTSDRYPVSRASFPYESASIKVRKTGRPLSKPPLFP